MIPKDIKDVKVLRDFYTQQRVQLCALADNLEEPWKTHFQQLKSDYDDVLKGLGPTDQAPAAIEANQHLQAFASLLCGANALCAMLGAHVATLKKDHSVAFNSALDKAIADRIKEGKLFEATELDNRITAAIKAKTEAGELVPKDTVTQLCSTAKDTGLKEGRAALEAEIKTKAELDQKVATRKSALQTASLPIPAAEIEALLGGTDEEFAALQTKAQARVKELEGKGVAYNSANALFAKVYLPDAEYGTFLALVDSIPSLKALAGGHQPGGEPLAGAGGKGEAKVPLFVVV